MTPKTKAPELGVDDAIRDKITGRRVGCGCLGSLIVAVFGAYFLVRSWTTNPDFALIATGLIGVGLFIASWIRGYHVLTGFATVSVLSIAAGLSPMLFRLFHPDQDLFFLPSLMRSWWLPVTLILVGGCLLTFLLVRMKDTISTPEALYSIQVAAAAKNVPAAAHGEFVGAAFGLLESCAKAGAWPVDGTLISGDTNLAGRDEHDPLIKILVVRTRPQEEPKEGSDWQWQSFGSPPWLQAPDTWVSGFPNLGPISVGELVVEPTALKYLPLRTGKPIVIPTSDLGEVRIALNSCELRAADGKRLAFQGMHIWRALSLASYLNGMHTRWEPEAGVIRGLAPVDASVPWPDVATPAELSDRMVDLSTGPGWAQRIARLVRPLATGDRAERVLAGHLCTAAECLGDDVDAALEAVDEASALLTALPVSVTGVDLHAASADLRGAVWVWREDWDAILGLVPLLDPWAGDDDEEVLEVLSALVEEVRAGGEPDLSAAEAGFPDSAFLAALSEWASIPGVEGDDEELELPVVPTDEDGQSEVLGKVGGDAGEDHADTDVPVAPTADGDDSTSA